MAMPANLCMIRHGEAEHNVAQRLERGGRGAEIPAEFYERHDWQQRLTPKGERQGQLAGQLLLREFGPIEDYFDRMYLSPFIRTRETAYNIDPNTPEWLKEDRIVERSWGTYGAAPLEERQTVYAATEKMRRQSGLYVVMDNGESIAYHALFRVRDWLDTLHRDMSDRNVLAITHGELMWTVRYLLENMLPEEWDALEHDPSERIRNCTLLHYTRQNPFDPEEPLSRAYGWQRMLYADDIYNSPNGGQWRELSGKRYLGSMALRQSVDQFPRLLS